jgi:nucleoside-diphosphate-sugar epimerase
MPLQMKPIIRSCNTYEQKETHRKERDSFIIGPAERILITGATGFIGARLVGSLLDYGFYNLRCFTRSSSETEKLEGILSRARDGASIEVIKGNFVSREDCIAATKDVAVIFHLAAARGEKSFPAAFMNSVVTTRNLLDASLTHKCLRRFVNISSFVVYTNSQKPHWRLLDESCPIEMHPEHRSDAYSYAKLKQDQIVTEYGRRFGIPYVIVRPGYVYGPGNEAITGRVGVGSFGIFLHLGGSNTIPFTYVDNCADAIALAGLMQGVDGEVFNVVDEDLPSSRQFLRMYKHNVRRFASVYIPHVVSYVLCCLWEQYSRWSEGQLPPSYNRMTWHASWKKTHYSNDKLKTRVGWRQKVPTAEGLRRYFEACREKGQHA